jgi:putative glutamine amidotransferase
MMTAKKTIGISLRVVSAEGYEEPRDALAHDWYDYLQVLFGDEVDWLLIPNLGQEAINSKLARWQLDGLILTGGNDVGENVRRDETELALLDFAVRQGVPVVGICRGLQLIWHYFGGELKSVDVEKHVASRHGLTITKEGKEWLGERQGQVNSFHTMGLTSGADELLVLARSDDGEIEAVLHRNKKLLGLMWHPERECPLSEQDRQLLRTILLGVSP